MNHNCPHCHRSLAWRLVRHRAASLRDLINLRVPLLCPFCLNPIQVKRHELARKYSTWFTWIFYMPVFAYIAYFTHIDLLQTSIALCLFYALGGFVLIRPRLKTQARYEVSEIP